MAHMPSLLLSPLPPPPLQLLWQQACMQHAGGSLNGGWNGACWLVC